MRSKRLVVQTPCQPQRGVVLLVTLVAMVILMISAIALVRSFNSSVLLSGNLAFKRDLVNQGERGMAKAIGLFKTGGTLATETARTVTTVGSNYSASVLAANDRGVPKMLIKDSLWTMTGSDITDDVSKVTVRYLIDRLCTTGTVEFSTKSCTYVAGVTDKGGSNWLKKAGSGDLPVYRISVRASGPHNTQVFLQTTATVSR